MTNMEFRGSEEGKTEEEIISPITQEVSLSECLVKLQNCEERYKEVKREIEKKHEETVDLKTRIDYLQDEKNRLSNTIDSRNTEILELRNEEEKLKKNIEECHSIAENQREEIRKYKLQVQERDTEIEKLKEEKNELEKRVFVLEKDNTNLEKLLESQKEKYDYKINDLTEELSVYHRKYNETKLQLDHCSEKLQKWEKEKEKISQEISLLKEKITSSRNFLIKIRDLSNEVNILLDSLHHEQEPESQEPIQSDSPKPPETVIELPSVVRESDSEKPEDNQDDYPWEDQDGGELIQF